MADAETLLNMIAPAISRGDGVLVIRVSVVKDPTSGHALVDFDVATATDEGYTYGALQSAARAWLEQKAAP